jgi:hypothetical protein
LIKSGDFCKSDFSDIESGLPKTLINSESLQHVKNTIKKYEKFSQVLSIVNPSNEEEVKKTISAFVAGYAKLREWPTNKGHRDAVSRALEPLFKSTAVDELAEIGNLLKERKYIVLQGPPGTGKTRTAKKIAEKMKKTFFTQFHAETTYSDFVFGIRPDLEDTGLRYKESIGIFTKALKCAIEHSSETVLLIIDEINRANLSNVLGPVFYLFEHKMDSSNVELEISPGFNITNLPDNFFVVATMNTADRSLAVVDFALRRRFAWFTLMPKPIDSDDFYSDDFQRISEIFDMYASSSELSLQPGQGYFIAASKDEMINRVKYELYPLIKEYLNEGLLRNAKEEFNSYFVDRVKKSLFE